MILPGIRQGSGEMGSRRCYLLGPDVSTELDSSRAVPQNVESRLNTYIVQHTCAPTNIMQYHFGHDLVYFLASRRHSLARKPLRKTPDSPLSLSQTSSTKLGCCLCRFRGNWLVTYWKFARGAASAQHTCSWRSNWNGSAVVHAWRRSSSCIHWNPNFRGVFLWGVFGRPRSVANNIYILFCPFCVYLSSPSLSDCPFFRP